nr:MAG TPA: restriction alleviation protein [Caudoviricetes sp.]
MEAEFLRPCDFCAKTSQSRLKTWPEPCPNRTQGA